MNNFLTEDTKAILLLCGVFGKNCSEKPLTQTEYTSLVHWLMTMKMRPCNLLQAENVAEAAKGSGIDLNRLEALLARGVQLGFSVEEWQRNGIWVMSRSDGDYPVRYKKHLKDKAPPLLFGVGNKALLMGGGVAIVGSRNVDEVGEIFTRNAAEACGQSNMPVVSGGARGVDQVAMDASIDAGGISIGVLAENLLKKSLEKRARHAIAEGRLLLISPYHPSARFTVGTAMGRNKLVYAMAEFGLVVSSDYKKGGTWTGAQEELRRENSRPVFVRTGENVPLGNEKLLEAGALEWPEFSQPMSLNTELQALSQNARGNQYRQISDSSDSLCEYIAAASQFKKNDALPGVSETVGDFSHSFKDSIYMAVLPILEHALGSPVSMDHLMTTLDVKKSQLTVWLNRAMEDGKVTKMARPVRYVVVDKINREERLNSDSTG